MDTSNAAAIARIKAATNGALDISLYPNSQLGTDPVMLNQVRSGAIQFFYAVTADSLHLGPGRGDQRRWFGFRQRSAAIKGNGRQTRHAGSGRDQ
ncbi:MAG: hypothetical protein POG74_05270 [Acidocella sp.]|nr:hypothetical protein [Acidocella sp.]